VSFAFGFTFACAVLDDGSVACWGTNTSGELGRGRTSFLEDPGPVVGLASKAKAVAVGQAHACALLDDGSVECWGVGLEGQVGDGTTNGSLTAKPVHSLPSRVVALIAGGDSTCTILDDQSAWCWGANDQGQLGDGTTTQRNLPVPVAAPPPR
jgi:alpha-tubulin suppressor-like RCC1 family protein